MKHYYVNVELEGWKADTLSDLFEVASPASYIVFCKSSYRCDEVAAVSERRLLPVTRLDRANTLAQQDRELDAFTSGRARVLVCCDASAPLKSLSYPTLLFNFDFPDSCKKYLDRVGTPYSKQCVVINLISVEELSAMRGIETKLNIYIEELPQSVAQSLATDFTNKRENV